MANRGESNLTVIGVNNIAHKALKGCKEASNPLDMLQEKKVSSGESQGTLIVCRGLNDDARLHSLALSQRF